SCRTQGITTKSDGMCIRLLQRWQRRSVVSGMRWTSQSDTVAIALLRDTVAVPTAWPANTVDMRNVSDRSPPAIGLLRISDTFIAAQVTSVGMCAGCPTGPTFYGWTRASPLSGYAQLLRSGEARAIPLQHVASTYGR